LSIVRKGRSHLLLKQAITKRQKDRLKEEEKQKDRVIASVPRLEDEIDQLRNELLEKDREIERREMDALTLKELHSRGLIDSEGNIID
jgi:hypothetical protein